MFVRPWTHHVYGRVCIMCVACRISYYRVHRNPLCVCSYSQCTHSQTQTQTHTHGSRSKPVRRALLALYAFVAKSVSTTAYICILHLYILYQSREAIRLGLQTQANTIYVLRREVHSSPADTYPSGTSSPYQTLVSFPIS